METKWRLYTILRYLTYFKLIHIRNENILLGFWKVCKHHLDCFLCVKAIWRLSSFTVGGRPQVPLRALFQTRVEPPTFRKLTG